MTDKKISFTEIIDYLKSEKIKTSVFGEFSSGKTTFLNALINENILTAAYEPTTAVPTRIRFEKTFNILVHLLSDQTLKLYADDSEDGAWRRYVGRSQGSNILGLLKKKEDEIKSFLSKWTKEGEKSQEVKEVIIELPLEWLKNKIELIDTPGPNNEFFKHKELTESLAAETDIAIMLIDGRQGGGKKSEFVFLNKINRSVKDSIVVVNFMDRLDFEEREEVLHFIRNDSIPKNWENPILPDVYGISAKLQSEGLETEDKEGLKKSFNEFLLNLKSRIETKRGSILLERLGKPDKKMFNLAKRLEKSSFDKDLSNAIKTYDELKDILLAAKLNPKPAEDGLVRCEERFKEKIKLIESIKNNFKTIDQKKISHETYLKKIKKINKNLIDLEEQDSQIQGKIKTVEKIIQKTKEDKKRIKDYLADAKHLTQNTKTYDSIDRAKKDYLAAKKIMLKYNYDTNDVEEKIQGCENDLDQLIINIRDLIDEFNKIDYKESLFDRILKVEKIYNELKILGAEKTSEVKTHNLIFKEFKSLDKKVKIATNVRDEINNLISLIDTDLALINRGVSVTQLWEILPKLLIYKNEIISSIVPAFFDDAEIKNIDKIKNKLSTVNRNKIKNLIQEIESIESNKSLLDISKSYKEINSILLMLEKNYSELKEYKKLLDIPYSDFKLAFKNFNKRLSEFYDLENFLNDGKQSSEKALKEINYKLIIQNFKVIDDAIKKSKINKQFIEYKDFVISQKAWQKELVLKIEKKLERKIAKVKKEKDILKITWTIEEIEDISAYLLKNHKVTIDLDSLRKLVTKSKNKSKYLLASILSVLAFGFIIDQAIKDGEQFRSAQKNNALVESWSRKNTNNFDKSKFFKDYNNALRDKRYESAEDLIRKSRIRNKTPLYLELINESIDNNYITFAEKFYYRYSIDDDYIVFKLSIKLLDFNYYTRVEKLFDKTKSQRVGIEIASAYIQEAKLKTRPGGLLFLKKVHTDESLGYVDRAKKIISKIQSQKESARLYKMIRNLTD